MVAFLTEPREALRADTREPTECYTLSDTFTTWTQGARISRDPIGEEGGLNLYGFVNNDPIAIVDPNGKIAVPLIITLLTAANALWAETCYNYAMAEGYKEPLDKPRHCIGACVYNKCRGLTSPLETLLGSLVYEIGSRRSRRDWADVLAHLKADIYGIIKSYDLSSPCESSCKKCPNPN